MIDNQTSTAPSNHRGLAVTDLATWLLEQIGVDERSAVRFVATEHIPADCWPPERVLAECAAKRALVVQVEDVYWSGSYAVRDVVLELIAQPYVDRPGFDETWRR